MVTKAPPTASRRGHFLFLNSDSFNSSVGVVDMSGEMWYTKGTKIPPSYPVHDSETEKQKDYSNINVNTTELVVIEIIGVIGACIVAGIKLAASFATGGVIPAW